MDIKEVEILLSVTRANIRYYEKEGLISPVRKKNNYRDYSDEDIIELKKVLVMRKIGFSVQEIRDMQSNSVQLSDALDVTIKRLGQTIEELRGSLEVAKKLVSEHTDFSELDAERYWDLITEKERSGEKFTDLFRDCAQFELDNFDRMMKYVFFFDSKKLRKKTGIVVSAVILFIVFIIRGIAKKYIWHGSFWEGFLYPVIIFAIASAVALPLFFLGKKKPKATVVIINILLVLCFAFLALLAVLVIIGVIGIIRNKG